MYPLHYELDGIAWPLELVNKSEQMRPTLTKSQDIEMKAILQEKKSIRDALEKIGQSEGDELIDRYHQRVGAFLDDIKQVKGIAPRVKEES